MRNEYSRVLLEMFPALELLCGCNVILCNVHMFFVSLFGNLEGPTYTCYN